MHTEYYFDHEKLTVYQETQNFIQWWEETSRQCRTLPNVRDQLDRASTSIALNIAEGNGKFSPKDRARYLQNAYGSALECAACLDVLVSRRRLTREVIAPAKEQLVGIVRMLVKLITYNTSRVSDSTATLYSASDMELPDMETSHWLTTEEGEVDDPHR